jgi:hypothetical protein
LRVRGHAPYANRKQQSKDHFVLHVIPLSIAFIKASSGHGSSARLLGLAIYFTILSQREPRGNTAARIRRLAADTPLDISPRSMVGLRRQP